MGTNDGGNVILSDFRTAAVKVEKKNVNKISFFFTYRHYGGVCAIRI